jgi:c-di-GMP-binding flagellar brake protein YcgR
MNKTKTVKSIEEQMEVFQNEIEKERKKLPKGKMLIVECYTDGSGIVMSFTTKERKKGDNEVLIEINTLKKETIKEVMEEME